MMKVLSMPDQLVWPVDKPHQVSHKIYQVQRYMQASFLEDHIDIRGTTLPPPNRLLPIEVGLVVKNLLDTRFWRSACQKMGFMVLCRELERYLEPVWCNWQARHAKQLQLFDVLFLLLSQITSNSGTFLRRRACCWTYRLEYFCNMLIWNGKQR